MKRYVHIVWSPSVGPIEAYINPEHAFSHARTMVGVDVTSLAVRDSLPDVVRDDINSDNDYEGDEGVTPVDGVVVTVDDIDDGFE